MGNATLKETGPEDPPGVWSATAVTVMVLVTLVYGDWVRHENVSVATVFSAQHSAAVRWSIHLASAVVLVVLWTAKPRRLQATVPVGLVLIMINALATTRIVMSTQEDVYSSVAGRELVRVPLRDHNNRFAVPSVCLETFSRTERTATIDQVTLAPPFLPLPVDWSELDDGLIHEFKCADGIPSARRLHVGRR